MNYFQHGDVLLFKVDKIPGGLEKCNHNRVQEGEATGHAHRLYGDGFTIFEDPHTKQRNYLRLLKETPIRHEEHKEILLPPGDYRIGIVREYDHFQEEAKRVID